MTWPWSVFVVANALALVRKGFYPINCIGSVRRKTMKKQSNTIFLTVLNAVLALLSAQVISLWCNTTAIPKVKYAPSDLHSRSEERRVGKEWRSRRAPEP